VSAYGLYDRLSEPFQKFAESLTGGFSARFEGHKTRISNISAATHHAGEYKRLRENGVPFEADVPRGHPGNIGFDFKQSQCVTQYVFSLLIS
jgi:hypothetical protein